MTELQRPEPQARALERVRRRFETVPDSMRRGRRGQTQPGVEHGGGSDHDPPGRESQGQRSPRQGDVAAPVLLAEPGQPTLAVTVALAVGLVLLAVGVMWFWQSWGQRSSEPIDDLLPRLEVAETGVDSAVDVEPDVESSVAGPSAGQPQPEADQTSGEASLPGDAAVTEMIVHVSGAVAQPGIVRMDVGGRVFEAVQFAGGATANADLDRVNLAAIAADGERIHIPVQGEEAPLELVVPGGIEATTEGAPVLMVDINEGSVSELEQLPGIGPSIAAAIVRTREARGPFLDVEELQEVPGIGAAKLDVIRSFVRVGR